MRLSPVPVPCGVAGFVLDSPSAPLPSAGSPQCSRPRQQPGALFHTPGSPGGFAISSSVLAGLEASSCPPSPHPPPQPQAYVFLPQSKPFHLISHCLQKASLPWVPGKPTSIQFLGSVWAQAEYSRNSTKNRLEASLEGFLEEVALELGLKGLSGELAGGPQLGKMT